MSVLLCLLLGHSYPPRREAPVPDTDAAFFAWNYGGNIARRGRYWFRARCRRCHSDEPYARTLVDA